MLVFGSGNKAVVAWGPSASVTVKVDGFEGLIDDSWVLKDMRVGASEIADVRQCFNEVSYIYALGNNQRECAIVLNFLVFLGAKDCKVGMENTVAIEDGLKRYISNRVSKRPDSPISITVGSFSRMGWLKDIGISSVDASRSYCLGTLSFIMKLEGDS